MKRWSLKYANRHLNQQLSFICTVILNSAGMSSAPPEGHCTCLSSRALPALSIRNRVMQDDDADSTLIKTPGKVNENPTIWISCTTETFGFSHLRQGERHIPLTQELCWQKYFQTHFEWNRTSGTGRDGSSLSMNCLVISRGLETEHLRVSLKATLTLWSSLISQPLPTPHVLILHAPLLQCSTVLSRG